MPVRRTFFDMPTPAASRGLDRFAPAVRVQLDKLAQRTVSRILEASEFYRDSRRFTRPQLVAYVRDNIEYVLNHRPADGDRLDGTSPPHRTGREHAARGIPLPDVLAAYRIGFAQLWETVADAVTARAAVDPGELIDAASELWWRADHFGHAVTEAYREAATEMLLRQEHERSAMVEGLVTGTIVERAVLWETAGRLGMPHEGHFLVAVAEARPLNSNPIPGIFKILQSRGVVSAWRLAPHQMVGVLALPEPDMTTVIDCLDQHASGNVGISPVFGHLDRAPRAFYLAGVALRSSPHPDSRVRLFAQTPIAVLVAAAPDASAAIAADVLGPVLALPDQDREALLQTFEVWSACGGSVAEAGARLFCHPNTVRYRLRKLAELTGHSTDAPGSLSELAVAVEAWRLVGDPGPER
jgi:hypothetical protein